MISFLDTPRYIRIFRIEPKESGNSRDDIGRISKLNYTIEPALRAQLVGEELAQVERIVSTYSGVDSRRRSLYCTELPIILREVMEHFEGDATESEKHFVTSAMTEAMRRLRKYQRESGTV
jgi:hypothetical protein